METSILSGLEASKALYSSLESRISDLKGHGIIPGLAAVLVGNNPAYEIYVKNKTKKFEYLGYCFRKINCGIIWGNNFTYRPF